MIEGFKISVWLHVPISPASGSNWSLKSVLDTLDGLLSGRDTPWTRWVLLKVLHGLLSGRDTPWTRWVKRSYLRSRPAPTTPS
jgi:hypothetical protein